MLATACRTVRDKVCGRRTEFDSTASTALAWRVASDMPARRCCDSAEARVREREAKPDERDARRRRAGGAARESADLVAAGNRRERYLPIWIGSVEATAIALEQQGVRPARPLTHDLLKEVIGALGRELEQVVITDLKEGTFFAELVFDGDIRVSARPSDSVALALRIGVPIHAVDAVLEEAGLIIPDEQEDEVEKFREFLDSVSPEDFRGAQP